VFVGKSALDMLMYRILLLIIPAVMIIGLGIFLHLSVRAESSLAKQKKQGDRKRPDMAFTLSKAGIIRSSG
jgi:hypothetical protein